MLPKTIHTGWYNLGRTAVTDQRKRETQMRELKDDASELWLWAAGRFREAGIHA